MTLEHAPAERLETAGEWRAIPVGLVSDGERRLDAAAFVAGGWGIRRSIERRPAGWAPLGSLGGVHQPPRLKGIDVDPAVGVPYLTAGQVFSVRPTPRRWLSPLQAEHLAQLKVHDRTIVVSRSGSVGRVTLTHRPHRNIALSDDLLRVKPNNDEDKAWMFALLLTESVRLMTQSYEYGHVVKHLEVRHLNDLPLPTPSLSTRRILDRYVARLFDLRDEASAAIEEAEASYTREIGWHAQESLADHVIVPSSSVGSGRRRLEAFHFNSQVQRVRNAVEGGALRVDRLRDVTQSVFAPGRFRRIYVEDGIPYRSSEELFAQNPPLNKRIHHLSVPDVATYEVEPGWLLMACSGQVYGLNGSVRQATNREEGIFVSHDVIRIVPDSDRIRPGYLLCALSHPVLGRPEVLRHAYGTSIPHLDPIDIREVVVPRLARDAEDRIADGFDRAVLARMEADELEDRVRTAGERFVQMFAATGRSPNNQELGLAPD